MHYGAIASTAMLSKDTHTHTQNAHEHYVAHVIVLCILSAAIITFIAQYLLLCVYVTATALSSAWQHCTMHPCPLI